MHNLMYTYTRRNYYILKTKNIQIHKLRKNYNVLKGEFHSEIERLRKKREKLKEVQKSYFNRAKKYKNEKMKYIQNHREAYKKPKLEEYYQKKE